MGKTAIYQLPWPELPDTADGPDGYQDLAIATEAGLTRVAAAVPPVSTFQALTINTPTGSLANGASAFVTPATPIPAKPWNRVIGVNAAVHTTIGSVSIIMLINNGGAVISAKRNVGTTNAIHYFALAANAPLTVQIQVSAESAGTNWTNDGRFTRAQVVGHPV